MTSWPVPPANITLHGIGDVQGAGQSRIDIMMGDLERSTVPQVEHRVTLGDCATNANPTDDAYFLTRFAARIPGGVHKVLGNHDVTATGSGPFSRTPAQAAAILGMPAPSYTVDMGFAVLVVLGMDGITSGRPGNIYGPAVQSWLNATLQANAGRTCLAAAHPPLMNTVGRNPAPDNGGGTDASSSCALGVSTSPFDYPNENDLPLRAVLADNPNAKAWISGHTHSLIHAPNIVKAETVGGHVMAMINTSSILNPGSLQLWTTAIASPFITVLDDRIEVRWRDHGAHQWVGCGSDRNPVSTVML